MNALEAVELYRFYHAGDDEVFALRGVSLQLRQGELLAVMGPSGSGKSSLLACLSGLDEPDGGRVELLGNRITRRSESERAALRARHIGILQQGQNLFEHLTVAGNIRLQLKLAGKVKTTYLDDVVEFLGLGALLSSRLDQLSGGEAAMAGLAVALAKHPTVLLLDEPTAEVDPVTVEHILALLARRSDDGGATIVVTHSRALAGGADRILRLRDGRVHDG